MKPLSPVAFVAAGLLAAAPLAPAAAAPSLIGTGGLNGGLDRSGLTGVLENGEPEALLGGFGSAIAYTGQDNRYVVVPDRGPNALPYDPAVDNTTSYVARFHEITLDVARGAAPGVGTVAPALLSTTSLSSPTPLAGTPPTAGARYFTGLSSGFDATNSPDSRRLDPEGVRVSNDGRSVFISDEYGPFVYQFDRATGERVRTYAVPEGFTTAAPAPTGATELAANASGRQPNRGMEGLAISPDGGTLYGIMQSPLLQDGALGGAGGATRVGTNVRILAIDVATGATREYVYELDRRQNGVSEIVAIDGDELLVDERDGDAGTAAQYKRINRVSLAGATDVSGIAPLPATGLPAGVVPVSKSTFIDLLDPAYGLAGPGFPEKIEGLAFGPDLPGGDHLLVVTADNDFLAGVPNLFYAFAVPRTDLPGFRQQEFARQGVAVAEPGTPGLLAAGLVALGVLTRRRHPRGT